MFGEQLPAEYRLGVGTDKWEKVGDLIEAGIYDLVRKRIATMREKVKDPNEAGKVADTLSDWWARNRGKVTIYWHRVLMKGVPTSEELPYAL